MSLRPHVEICTNEDHGEVNFIYWLKIHISEGLRFSLPTLDTLIFTLYLTPPYQHSCEHYPHSIRGLCTK